MNKILAIFIALFLIGSISNAMADDLATDPSLIPPSYEGPMANSPTWETNVDNGDGTWSFTQGIDAASTSPHYIPPVSGGFSIYSWWDEDYGWQHDFPYTAGHTILSATLTIRAWDVDSESWQTDGEFDGIFGDGTYLNPQYLQGNNNQWSVTTFDVNPSKLADGILDVDIDIDMTHARDYWATTLNYSELTIKYTAAGANQAPYKPTLSVTPSCPGDDDDLSVSVTGPNPADPDGDAVTYEYRWFVDVGSGFYIDDDFAGRGDHTGNTVPAADTQSGDKWRVQVTAVDTSGVKSDSTTVDFGQIDNCAEIPEFPSIVLPIISVFGLLFIIRKGKIN